MGFLGDALGGIGEAFGLNRLPGLGFLFPDPAEGRLTDAMERVRRMYAEQEPINRAAQMQGLKQQMSLYGPYNEMVGGMMGLPPGTPAVPVEGALQDPYGAVLPPPPTASLPSRMRDRWVGEGGETAPDPMTDVKRQHDRWRGETDVKTLAG